MTPHLRLSGLMPLQKAVFTAVAVALCYHSLYCLTSHTNQESQVYSICNHITSLIYMTSRANRSSVTLAVVHLFGGS